MNQNWTNVVLWIVFGAIIGWVASAIVGVGSNLIIDIVVGIVGAFLGGWIMGYSKPGSTQLPGSTGAVFSYHSWARSSCSRSSSFFPDCIHSGSKSCFRGYPALPATSETRTGILCVWRTWDRTI